MLVAGDGGMDALAAADAFLFEGFRLDRHGVSRRDDKGCFVPVPLGSRALEVPGVLVERAGDLVSRDEIMNAVWPATVVESSNLPVQIAALRRLLDNGRADGSCIQTVPGRGYRFAATVTPILEPRSGNGVEELIAEEREVLVPAPGQPEVTPPNALSLQRKRLRRASLAALTGVLCLLAAVVTTSNWHLPWFNDARSGPRLSIVVLPFTNLSSDPDKQYFADGITEDLTTDLSRILNMFVISANTASTYRNKPVDAKQIGRELGVHYVLEGSVERSGNQVRVNAQLIDAKTDTHLWADRFDHEVSNLFALQSEITGRIANTLKLEVIAAEAGRAPERPDALDFIFRGRDLFFGRPPSRENYKKAIALYEQALALDPQSAEAKTFLAGALVNRVIQKLTDTRTVDFARAERLIDEALAAVPHIALAHYVKGTALRAKGRWEDAVAEFETARSLATWPVHCKGLAGVSSSSGRWTR
jgi:TolB-like protein/DNA-binding winged helix-turn-helix (wHTH) protein